jgi:formylglycine-generating enzyme required for sulfatase activity
LRLFFGILSAALLSEARADSMIEVPAGLFYRGSTPRERLLAKAICQREWLSCNDALFRTEGPSQWIYLSTFWISATEVSQLEYQACVNVEACPEPAELGQPKGDELPVVGVTWQDAHDYCAFIGARLPTEAEWEKAARGKDGRIFPWGDVFVSTWANHGQAGPPSTDAEDGYELLAPVNSMPNGASAFGLLHMAGNVWEWVEDEYLSEAYLSQKKRDPFVAPSLSAALTYHVIRGGSYLQPLYTLRAAYRGQSYSHVAQIDIGFRCAR